MPSERLARPALQAARSALDELESDEVPASLRRVAASSARMLPPPLAAMLLRYLDEHAWLRELAAGRLGERGREGDPPSAWSRLFLERPAGWEEEAERLSREDEADAAVAAERATAEEVDRLRAKVARLEGLLAAERDASAGAGSELDERADAELRDRLQASNRALRAAIRELEERLDGVLGERAGLEDELGRADRRIAELKRRLASRPRPTTSGAERRTVGAGDPVALARFLDDLRSSIERARATDEPGYRPPRPVLPAGVRPDGAAGVEWLLGIDSPATALIDGYNVAFLIDPAPDAAVRARVENLAGRLARLAEGPVTVVVFWDSAHEAFPVGPGRRSTGVEVRYVPSADDAIVEWSSRVVNPVVISGDRDVRERAERLGAVALWSQALVAWGAIR